MEPAQQSSSDQEKISVNVYEPIDEFLHDVDPVDALVWDHSGDLDSPPVDDTNQADAVNSSRWSTAINRVNTSCNQPDNTFEMNQFRPRLQGTSELEVGDQSVFEEANSSEKEQLENRNTTATGVIMDEEDYRKRSAQFKKLFRDVEDSISDFTAEDVFVQNLDSCEQNLDQIKNKFNALRTSLRDFYDEFDTEKHPAWETEWEEKLNVLSSKYKKN